MDRATEYERGYEGEVDLIVNALEVWVAEARLDVSKFTNAQARRYAKERKEQAVADFEKAKQDPEGCPLLNKACAIMDRMQLGGTVAKSMTEADILDKLLERAGLPWDISPKTQLEMFTDEPEQEQQEGSAA